MELRYLLRVIHRSRRFLAASAVVAALIGLAATYVLSQKYDATTAVLIRPRSDTGSQAGKSLLNYPVSFNIPIDNMSKTYADIMTSRAVATRVVDLLHLDTLKPPRASHWYMRVLQDTRADAKMAVLKTWDFLRYGRIEDKTPYESAVDNVMNNLHAKPVTDTFLFSLTATAHDPQMAARIANTAAKVFTDYMRNSRANEESTGAREIETRLETVRIKLADARDHLQAFGHDTNAASLDKDLQLQLESMETFQAEREETLKRIDGDNAEIAALKGELAQQRETIRSSTTVARNPVITELQAQLAKDKVEYAGLATTLAPDHPKMRRLRAQITAATARLAAATLQVPDHQTSTRNPAYEDLTKNLLDQTAARDAQVAHLGALNAAIDRYRSQTSGLAGQKGQLSRLTFNVDVLENEYRLLDHEHAQAELAAVEQVPEVRQLGHAAPPVYQARPIKIYYVAGGLAAGFLVALFLVLVADYVDPRVYDVEALQQRLDLPFVSVVPRLTGARRPAGLSAGTPAGTLHVTPPSRSPHDD